MATRRSALGRGLGALIPAASDTPGKSGAGGETRASIGGLPLPSAGEAGARHTPTHIPVDLIDPNPEQPRRQFDPEQHRSLSESIQRHGVLQPVVVRRAGGGRYELVVGERRWRASRAAGLETIPVVVADTEAGERLELAIVENVQRHDLNPIELAHAYRVLADRGATQEEIGRQVSLDRSSVANHLRLLDLSRELQEDVETSRISMGHAKALLQLDNPERRRHLRDRIVRDSLSVRAAERLAREMAGPPKSRAGSAARSATAEDPEMRGVAEALQRHLQARVRIRGTTRTGRVEIEYSGAEDLQRIVRLLLEGV